MNIRKIGYWIIGVIIALIALRIVYRSLLSFIVLGVVLYAIYKLFIQRDKDDWFKRFK